MSKATRWGVSSFAGVGVLTLAVLLPILARRSAAGEARRVIVQGTSVAHAATAVRQVGGRSGEELAIIRAVSARLSSAELEVLRQRDDLQIYRDSALEVSAFLYGGEGGTVFPAQVDADDLHAQGIDGSGVTIAFVDTGIWRWGQRHDADGFIRYKRIFDAFWNDDLSYTGWLLLDPLALFGHDSSGHGAHVASVATNSDTDWSGNYNGIAPNAGIVVAKAFDRHGKSTYSNAIQSIDWVVQRKNSYNIRVLNLSFSAPVNSYYWDDPLNQAVMAAWQAGIVVVASAGNQGPDPLTIGVPGNVPYVITVGAMSNNYSSSNDDDFLTSFSGAGPTYEGFVKPEVVAPGGHILGLMSSGALLREAYPEFGQYDYFSMSGTSQAASLVSGIVALMLDHNPGLTPDEVKCRLMDTARQARDADGFMGYSVFQQGAGMVNAYEAVFSSASGCANQGLVVGNDLAGIEHYGGPANQDSSGDFHLPDLPADGSTWDGTYDSNWYAWNDLFSSWYIWNDARGPFESDFYAWNDSWDPYGHAFTAGLAEPVDINAWVGQE